MRRFWQWLASAATASVVPFGLIVLLCPAAERAEDGDVRVARPRGQFVKEIYVTPGLIELARQRRSFRSHEELRRALEGLAGEKDWYEVRIGVRSDDGEEALARHFVFPYAEPNYFAEVRAVLETIVQKGPGLEGIRFDEAKVYRVARPR
ncbi:hypothetical protein OJF2_67040 [Aquisphaera giovannonii]|uniref:Uncharacterized protein n=1 Tax=Aquisphaera giovannonii TaxID=406548 RepID=A0A5B9WBX3_9BACT|nr:hypothetical protein [Aquisphaera giovannonii]QEH38106.1 hypothetical protein OJF2_67040 [Aquisphaera giovannonii]